ncbi:MAG TPA: DUF2167 domain-containing protein [Longimicrobiales bacterium]
MRPLMLALAGLLGMSSIPAVAQEDSVDERWMAEFESSLTYQQGTITLGDGLATLHVPETFRFLGPDDAARVLVEGWGNPPGEPPLGMLVPAAVSPLSDEGWGVVITYEEDGYIEDDDAAELDYAELLRNMQEATREENPARIEAGYPPIELVGWAAPPHYDSTTHKLYWAKELKFGDYADHTLNYNIRVLGRKGVLVLNAVSAMRQLEAVEADMQSVLGFVEFNEGHRYADYIPGVDKVAAYGIAGLIVGKVAAKVGLLKLLLGFAIAAKKFVVAGVVGLAAVLAKAFGKKEREPDTV